MQLLGPSRLLLQRGPSRLLLQQSFDASAVRLRAPRVLAMQSASAHAAVDASVAKDPAAPIKTYNGLISADDGSAQKMPSPPEPPGSDTAASVASVDSQPKPRKVAELDAQHFRLDPSVARWQGFQATDTYTGIASGTVPGQASLQQGPFESLTGMARRAAQTAVIEDLRSAAYWAYCSARIAFFIAQAVAGLVAHHAYETAQGSSRSPSDPVIKTPLTSMTTSGAGVGELTGRVAEALETFKQDYGNISSGAYGLPWDMTTVQHRQYNPVWQLRRSAQFVRDAVQTLRRRVRNTPDEVWLQGDMYPQYYQSTFHFQGDGWFSDKSAQVYEHSTETLFFGRQDAMQRMTLVPVSEWVKARGADPSQLRLLEVAAGTGRFHTFIKDAYPTMPTVCSDLSPFYLARARENVAYWKRMRQADARLGDVDDAGVRYVQCAAEAIAAPDASFDILAVVYLFHELPEAVRRKAAAEFLRVLKPGGLCVFTDSVQTGDRPSWDNSIGNFQSFNEPYYRCYVSCDLGRMFADAGFKPETKWLCSATKTLSFTKPL